MAEKKELTPEQHNEKVFAAIKKKHDEIEELKKSIKKTKPHENPPLHKLNAMMKGKKLKDVM